MESGDELGDNPYITPGSDVEPEATTRRRQPGARKTVSPKQSGLARSTKCFPHELAAKKAPVPGDKQTATQVTLIPSWANLPYHVLFEIFRYAARPLTEIQHVKWLLAASGVCRAFTEPALAALYESPPLLTRSMAHGLVSLLSKDPSTTLISYRPKIKELWIDVDEIAQKTYKGQPLDFRALVSNLPRLKFVQFYHRLDDPPYRSLDTHLRWRYPDALFEALNGVQDSTAEADAVVHAKLAGWQWNRRMMGHLNLAGIVALHQTPAFAGLKKVSFVNYQVPSLHAKANVDNDELAAQDHAFIQSMADAIRALPALEHLSFESSTVVNEQLLPFLPKTLVSLELVNCWDINGDDFASYLLSSGYNLKHLVLRHNQSLSLSFLTVLGSACPSLQLLSVDLKTFNHHEFYHDGDPSYDELLTANQVPDWPRAVESIQILHMKKWTAEAAEMFFQSLVDSAPKLLKLRKLDLKAMLSIPIQERSQLRNKWEAKLKQVFLREQKDPSPLYSMRQPVQQQVEADVVRSAIAKKFRKSREPADASPARRSTRLAMQRSHPSSRASSVGRDLRHVLGRPSYAEPDTDEDLDCLEDDKAKVGLSGQSQSWSPMTSTHEIAPFRHGMCEKVDIQLDNQKATETTLTMDDFVDSESDDLSDDDWNGEDEDSDTGYAW
ncbi:hypothetical protein VTI74DRAFT_7909 [Chaetomium olivicolor]